MGASAILGSSLLGSTIGALTGSYNNDKQIKAQREENRLDRAHQTSERIASQEYNTSERLATQEYNTPSAQVERYRDAGLNPALMTGGTAQSVVNPQSSSPVGAGGHGLSPLANPLQGGLGSGFADIVKGLSDIGLFDSNKRLINEQVESLILKNTSQELLNDFQNVQNEIRKVTKSDEIGKSFQEYLLAEINVHNAHKQGDDIQASTSLKKAQEQLAHAQSSMNLALSKLHGNKAVIAELASSELKSIINTWKNTQKSAQAANYGAANQSNSQAELNKIDAKSRVELNDATIAKLGEDVRSLVSSQGVDENRANLLNLISQRIKPSSDHSELVFWKDFAKDVINTGLEAFATVTTRGAYKALSQSQKEKIDFQLEIMKEMYK